MCGLCVQRFPLSVLTVHVIVASMFPVAVQAWYDYVIFVNLSVHGYLDCFSLWFVMSNAVNIHVQSESCCFAWAGVSKSLNVSGMDFQGPIITH